MSDFGKYWFGDGAALEQAGNGCREAGSSVGIGDAAQDSVGSGAVETDIGYS